MSNVYIITFLVLVFFSCNLNVLGGHLSKIKHFLENKYGVVPYGISEEGMEGKYKEFGIMFNCSKPMKKKEAINFVNKIYFDLIEKVNQYPSLQNEFVEQPIPKRCLFVEIIFLDEKYDYFALPAVSSCDAHEKYFHLEEEHLRYGKRHMIREDIYYEYD